MQTLAPASVSTWAAMPPPAPEPTTITSKVFGLACTCGNGIPLGRTQPFYRVVGQTIAFCRLSTSLFQPSMTDDERRSSVPPSQPHEDRSVFHREFDARGPRRLLQRGIQHHHRVRPDVQPPQQALALLAARREDDL